MGNSLPYITRFITLRTVMWTGHVALLEKTISPDWRSPAISRCSVYDGIS
jgi:hypothetical protein